MTTIGSSTVLAFVAAFVLSDAGVTPARQGSDPRTVESAILAASAEMTRAGEAVDAERLFSFMLDTDKGSVIQNGVFLATREEALRQVKDDLRSVTKIEYRWKRQHVTLLSAGAALLTAEGESIVTIADGRVFTTPFAQSVVFVMREGQWKAIHAHQSSPRVR